MLTEPPADAFARREIWIPKIFGDLLLGHTTYEHGIGFDGFVRDIVIESAALDAQDMTRIIEKIHEEFFGTGYKAAYRVFDPKSWNKNRSGPRRVGPENLEVSAASMNEWLFGENAVAFSSDPLDTDAPLTDAERAISLNKEQVGVYYSDPAGLVVLVVPRQKELNDAIASMRRFVVDTDTLLGAAVGGANSQWLMFVGRERTTGMPNMPPLRLDTIFTLAAGQSKNLAQSYQRTAPFAGQITDPDLLTTLHSSQNVEAFEAKFLESSDRAQDPLGLAGMWDYLHAVSMTVDWAPILLSRELTHTEYGQLLNITDQMLKGWSSANRINYVAFPYPKPFGNPDADSLHSRLQREMNQNFSQLTFNWNTAGFGSWAEFGEVKIFTMFRTGALPTSYFPDDGSFEIDGAAENIIKAAENDYWDFFSGLRDPYLARAAQYAALHIIFQAYPVQAVRTEPLVGQTAYESRWNAYIETVEAALVNMQRYNGAETGSVDNALGLDLGSDHHCFRQVLEPEDQTTVALVQRLKKAAVRLGGTKKLATLISYPEQVYTEFYDDVDRYNARAEILDAEIDQFNDMVDRCNRTQTCSTTRIERARDTLMSKQNALEAEEQRLEDRYTQLQSASDLSNELRSRIPDFGECDAAWAAVVEGVPPVADAVYKTPGIVISNDAYDFGSVGGHNLDGRAVRVVPDTKVTKGTVSIDAENGVIRLNPAEMGNAHTVARTFERDFRRFVSEGPQFQRKVIRRVEAALAHDTRAIKAFDTLALQRSGRPFSAERGLRTVPEDVSTAPANSSHVFVRSQAVALDARKAEELATLLNGDTAAAAVRTLENGTIELSWPGGKPPVAILTRNQADLPRAIEEIVAHVANSNATPNGTLRIVNIDGALSLRDMTAIKYSGVGRPTAGSGGGMGLPPGGGTRVAAASDGGNRGGGFFFRRFATGKKIAVGFFKRQGDAAKKLLRTDFDWANAEVSTIALRNLPGDGGYLATSIRISYKSAESGQPLLARLRAFLPGRKPTDADAAALRKAIEMARSNPEELPLWQQLEAIRLEFGANIDPSDAPRLLWRMQDTVDDFYVVENDQAMPPAQTRNG